eukprot:Hpha_TRINITY_DN16210_c0_g2::TRINITY_DN16210_c0_g2_i11::g.14049::m.14049
MVLGTIHPLEGDGINPSFFEYLAKENKGLSSAEVWIPSTVIFEQGFAKAWYFSERVVRKEGDTKKKMVEVKKRTGKECDLEAIRVSFTRDAKHDADVCAMFVSLLPNSHDHADGSAVQFFDRKTLKEFLNPYVQKPKGLLQKFVRPKGYNNTVIQAVWSPTVLVTEARRNRYSLMDKHVDVFSRSSTFEGSSENSIHVVVAPVVVEYIRLQCEQVAAHFVSTEHLSISRMVLYFKVDHQNVLRLLYPASLRVQETSRRLQPTKSPDTAPLNLAVSIKGQKVTARSGKLQDPAAELSVRSPAFTRVLKDAEKQLDSIRKSAPQASDFNYLATNTVVGGWTPPPGSSYSVRHSPTRSGGGSPVRSPAKTSPPRTAPASTSRHRVTDPRRPGTAVAAAEIML